MKSMFLGLMASLLFSVQTPYEPPKSESHHCDAAMVIWKDASIHVKTGGLDVDKIEELVPVILSYGCISQTADYVIIIHSFVNGKPDDFLIVPKSWTNKIITFKADDKGEANGKTDNKVQ